MFIVDAVGVDPKDGVARPGYLEVLEVSGPINSSSAVGGFSPPPLTQTSTIPGGSDSSNGLMNPSLRNQDNAPCLRLDASPGTILRLVAQIVSGLGRRQEIRHRERRGSRRPDCKRKARRRLQCRLRIQVEH